MNIAISKPKLGKDSKAFLAKKHHMLTDGGQERQDFRSRGPGDARDHRSCAGRRQSRHQPCGEGGAEGV